ncbi:MAG: hypothetical protein ABF991_00585 [Liquorilactobacillus hordei]|uniref:hypothetical protein n=1 Tax=Liquorilactobacillus hordei TaxID=468911 RepID=UPI0039EAD83B
MKKATEQAIEAIVSTLESNTLNEVGLLLLFNKPAEVKYIHELVEFTNEYLQSALDGINKELASKPDMDKETLSIYEEIIGKIKTKMEEENNE